MKRKDLALIAIIVIISAVASLLLSKAIFASPSKRNQQVEVVEPITADFPDPDKKYFNEQAFDPTKIITIGENANPDPFRNTSPQ